MSIHAVSEAGAISEYTGMGLLGIFSYNNSHYGWNATDIFELTGADDDGTAIAAYVQTGKLFSKAEEIRCARAYIRCQAASDLTITTQVDILDADESSSEVSEAYTAPGRSGTKQQIRTVRLRRDLKGLGWAFKLANVDGGAFSVKGLEVEPEGIEIDV